MFNWLRILASKLHAVFSKQHLDEDFAEELHGHLASLTEENVRRGMTPEEANRTARLRLGGLTQLQESQRELRGLPLIETFFQDIRCALRTLRKNPGFTLMAVFTLALGIGANAAIFSMAQGFLLRPVSLPHLDRLVAIGELQANDRNDTIRVSPANYLDWASQSRSFDHISGFYWENVNLGGVGTPLTAQGIHVSSDFFDALGVKPLLGGLSCGKKISQDVTRKSCSPEACGSANSAVTSVVGKTVRINSRAYTVIGVMDKDCKFPQTVELWLPLALEPKATHNRNQRWRPDLNTALKEGTRNSSDGHSGHRIRNAFVIAQLSLALILMVGAGLMVRGFRALLDTNRQFEPASLLTMRLVLPDSSAYKDPHHRAAFFQQTLNELAAPPGVRSATMVTGFPFSGLLNSGPFQVEGQPTEAGAQRFAVLKDISPNYFETMGALILGGRGFNDFDGPDSAPAVLVSERLAKLYWPNESPLGHRLKVGGQDSLEPLTIVGVVSDIKYAWSSRLPEPAIYRPYQQAPQNYMAFGLRTKGDPTSLVSAAGFAVARVSSDQTIFEVKSLDRVIRENSLPIAYTAVMMAVAGGLALFLASVGVYAVMAYSVVERTHEIGVRMVVGARPGEIVRLILRRGVRLMLLGFAFGLPCAYGLAHLEAKLLAGISAKDFWTFSWICSVMAGVSLLACYIPARRAIRVDPIVALRYE